MATPAQRRTGLPVGSRSSHTLQVGLCSGYVAQRKHELIAVSFPCRMATIWRWLDPDHEAVAGEVQARSEEHTSELQSLMRISYAVFCLKKKKKRSTGPQRRETEHHRPKRI